MFLNYNVMQVCLRGHKITDEAEGYKPDVKPFCPKCGERTIDACPSCNSQIPGRRMYNGRSSTTPARVEQYCCNCGQAYPWTATRLKAGDELVADLEGLDEKERSQLQEALRDLSHDGPRTELGVARFKKLAKKASEVVGGTLWKIGVDVASEAAKKLLAGP